jgi:hypothetical protein
LLVDSMARTAVIPSATERSEVKSRNLAASTERCSAACSARFC